MLAAGASHRNWILLKNPGHFERESEMTGDSSTHLSLTSPKKHKKLAYHKISESQSFPFT
ncbi:hypothetical protein BK749_22490 [Bacillus thuringiensis serovar vazensis]|uniref:Uncharacterized protein n=1 Tax=Bacillus thuringiensis serovar vazensis TaxID=180867 RepID=A0A243CRF8_BACTU|nr:hypothetical protein BK749_22490 [Bacillus thuringiensis serovar vazensis]